VLVLVNVATGDTDLFACTPFRMRQACGCSSSSALAASSSSSCAVVRAGDVRGKVRAEWVG
jgi:hypothetical protein